MKSIYNFGIYCYKQLVALAGIRNVKARKLTQGQKGIFDYLSRHADPQGGYLWIHASSLGEFEQGRPLIEAIKKAQPDTKILLTFFSPSGYEVRKNYSGADLICYLPFDLPGNVRRLLDLTKPTKAIFIKYEFWANYLNELKRRNIPTYIVSAIFRPKQIFFRSYGGYFRRILKNFTHLYIQDERSRQLLASIGIDNVSIVGDTRFDRVGDIRRTAKELPLVEAFAQGKKILIAGSSWPKDEEFITRYFNHNDNIKLILAPHEIHESHLQSIEKLLKRPVIRYTQATIDTVQSYDCLIIDCFGLLSSIYRYGTVAYVGGGFGAGIHNIAEAAVYDIPVIFGPNHRRFKEARELIACGGGFAIHNGQEFATIADKLLTNPKYLASASKNAGDYISTHAGATKLILKELFGIEK